MQDVQFFDSKSGDKTCSINSIRLHSSYDPVKEAQRYVSSLDINFVPSLIVVTEPALSYCAYFLRKRFPKTILVAIRFSNLFIVSDSIAPQAEAKSLDASLPMR